MAILTGLWHRLSKSLPWVCLSPFPLRGVARPGHGLGSISQCRRDLCQGLVVHLWLRGIPWRVGMRLIQVARSLLIAVSPPVLPILGEKGAVGGQHSECVTVLSLLIIFICHFSRLVCFSNFLINGEALHLTVLCLIWFRVTTFSIGPVLPCSITSSSSMSRQLWLIILLFRRGWMSYLLRELLNHLLVVLVSILACLWFLSILVASGPYLTFSILIIICIYLLLRCQLSDMYGSLFSMVIMLSPLIYRMLIYIFLLLSISVVSYDLFSIMCLISGRFYLLGWPQPLGFHSPN